MQQDVFGLDVAMDHPVAVRIVEGVGHFGRDLHRFVDAQLMLSVELVPKRLAFDIGHHIVEEVIGPPVRLTARAPAVEERQNVGMLQLGGGLNLLDEPIRAQDRGELGLQHLDGDFAVVLEVLGEVDGGHAPRAELPLDAVPVGEGAGQVRERVDQGRAIRCCSSARKLKTITTCTAASVSPRIITKR